MNKHAADYSVYHLHELEAALKSVDELANPEEARLIKGFLDKGGYKYPDANFYPDAYFVIGTRFLNNRYRNAITGVIWCLLLVNLLTLVISRSLLPLIPIALQGSILAAVYFESKYARLLIRAWCGLLIFSGASGFLSMLLSGDYNLGRVLYCSVTFSTGAGFLLLTNRYVHLVYEQSSDVKRSEPPSELS